MMSQPPGMCCARRSGQMAIVTFFFGDQPNDLLSISKKNQQNFNEKKNKEMKQKQKEKFRQPVLVCGSRPFLFESSPSTLWTKLQERKQSSPSPHGGWVWGVGWLGGLTGESLEVIGRLRWDGGGHGWCSRLPHTVSIKKSIKIEA